MREWSYSYCEANVSFAYNKRELDVESEVSEVRKVSYINNRI